MDSYLQDVRTRLEYGKLGVSLDVGEGRQMTSGPYLPPQQPIWRPGYLGSGGGKKDKSKSKKANQSVMKEKKT